MRCCCAAWIISGGKSKLLHVAASTIHKLLMCPFPPATQVTDWQPSEKTPPQVPTARNSTSCISTISPVSGQRPHLCISPSGPPVFILPRIGASVSALPDKQRLCHLLAGALILWVAAVTRNNMLYKEMSKTNKQKLFLFCFSFSEWSFREIKKAGDVFWKSTNLAKDNPTPLSAKLKRKKTKLS